jgi:hypothetical protein
MIMELTGWQITEKGPHQSRKMRLSYLLLFAAVKAVISRNDI